MNKNNTLLYDCCTDKKNISHILRIICNNIVIPRFGTKSIANKLKLAGMKKHTN